MQESRAGKTHMTRKTHCYERLNRFALYNVLKVKGPCRLENFHCRRDVSIFAATFTIRRPLPYYSRYSFSRFQWRYFFCFVRVTMTFLDIFLSLFAPLLCRRSFGSPYIFSVVATSLH